MDEYTKTAVARHERLIKQLKKKIARAQALHKSMPGKTVKQRKERDNVKYSMELELQNKASSLKTAPMNWYIMKAYAESGLPRIADVAKEYIENNDEPIDKSKKETTPKKTEYQKHYDIIQQIRIDGKSSFKGYEKLEKDLASGKFSDEILQLYKDRDTSGLGNIASDRLSKYKDGVLIPKKEEKKIIRKKRTGQPTLLKRLEAKKKSFSSAEAKLTHYYKKRRKEELAKAKKMYPSKPNLVKDQMDSFDDSYGPKGSRWSKNVKKLATAERQIKKLRRLYIAFWKMGFDEKMLLHQFRVHEMEDHPKARYHGNSQEAIYKRLGEEEIIPRNKLINEMSEILQEIREGENLEKFIESIESIEVLNEEKLSSIMLDDENTKEAYIKLRTSLVETLFKIYQIYRKNLASYDGGMVDWLGRSDDKIYKLKDRTIVKLTYQLFDDYIFDKYTPF